MSVDPEVYEIAEEAAAAQIREIREFAAYSGHPPAESPAAAGRYILAMETWIANAFAEVAREREERRRAEERNSGPLYWIGYLVIALILALTVGGLALAVKAVWGALL